MTFGSLFAGIGGMDLGLERAGMECRWQVEIDPFCNKVLEKHWPGVKRYGDITKLSGDELERVDLVCGGFPCQDVSSAGLRAGIGTGTRSGLYVEMVRLIRLLRPSLVLMENVSGLLVPTVRGEPAPISRVLGDLATIGYDALWESIPASTFGAPHERDRVFIVANSVSDESHGYKQKPATEFNRATEKCFSSDSWRERIKGVWKRSFQRSAEFSWCQNIGSPEELRGRSDIPQPLLRRVDYGLPHRVDRTRSIGNAVVPQVAQWIGEQIIAMTRGHEQRHGGRNG